MKLASLLVVVLVSLSTLAQNIGGKAYYQSKTTVDMEEFGNKEMSEDMKKQIQESMKGFLEKTYILTFQGGESLYKEDEKLETGEGNRGFGMMMNSFTPGDLYKNLETRELLEENEFFGKQFLVVDTLSTLEWKVEKESKQIGQYVAIKATALKKVGPNDFAMMRRRDRDEKKEGETAKDSTDRDDPLAGMEMPKEVLVTAWFTPQIPVQHGPGEYNGLPGLILELNVDRTTLLCSKIVLNTKEAYTIESPTKGKKVTREEYDRIVKEKMDEMRENFRSKGGRRGGERRFGG